MNFNDWFQFGCLALWVLSGLVVTFFGNKHFDDKKMEQRKNWAVQAAQNYVAYYDQQQISNPEKLSGAINDVAKSLQAKGFTIDDQALKDIEASVEKAVADLHVKKEAVTTPVVEEKVEQPEVVIDDNEE